MEFGNFVSMMAFAIAFIAMMCLAEYVLDFCNTHIRGFSEWWSRLLSALFLIPEEEPEEI